MRFAIFLLCVAGCLPAVAQAPAPSRPIRPHQVFQNPNVTITALNSTYDRNVYHLKGGVEIKTDSVIVTAYEATYDVDTGEIEGRGVVRIKPSAPLNRRGLSQFGIK